MYVNECEISPESGTGKCHYYHTFGGYTLQDAMYTGKVVPFYAIAAPSSNGVGRLGVHGNLLYFPLLSFLNYMMFT